MERCDEHGSCQEKIRNAESQIERMDENQTRFVEGQNDLRERLVIAEQSTKSAHHRIDGMEEQTKAIIRMSVSVENMAGKMEEMINLYKDHDNRIVTLEHAPADKIMSYWQLFVCALITSGGGIVLGVLMKGLVR